MTLRFLFIPLIAAMFVLNVSADWANPPAQPPQQPYPPSNPAYPPPVLPTKSPREIQIDLNKKFRELETLRNLLSQARWENHFWVISGTVMEIEAIRKILNFARGQSEVFQGRRRFLRGAWGVTATTVLLGGGGYLIHKGFVEILVKDEEIDLIMNAIDDKIREIEAIKNPPQYSPNP